MARKTAARKAVRTRKTASAGQNRGRGRGREAGEDVRSGYRDKRRAEKIEAAGKKDGCLPKLGMFLLPFIAAGAYLLLRA